MEAIRPAVNGPLNLNGSSHTDPDFALPPPPAPFPTELINHSGQTVLSGQYLSALQSTCASALASLLPADISNTYGSLTESDRQLATTLTELLEITYELDEMGPSPAYEEVAGPSRANPMSSGPSNGGLEACFTTLLRHLESMDISHNTSTVASDGLEPAVNAARQELALVRIQTLTRVILIQVRARESDVLYRYDHTSSNIGDSLGSTSLPDHTSTLPKYDHHDPTRSDDLPDYAEPATRLSIDKKAPAESSSRAQATITSEKTMHDLDNLIAAIERLNSLTSGYSDQRSVLGPRSRSPSAFNGKIRHKGNPREERLMTEEEKMGELEDIWRKIESAHGKHRMRDDQRADMDGVQERRAEERGRFLQELYERVEASRLKDQDGIPGVVDGDLARARELRNRDRYLKKLLEVSAESRYSDQDAAAPSDEHARISRQQARQTYIHDLVQRMQSGRLDSQDYPISPDDRIDAKRQDLVDSLVSFSSSGRFADQDSLAPAPRQQNRKDSGEIVTMKDFFKSDPPTTTATNGAMTSGNVVDKEEEKKNGTMKKIKGIMRRSSLGLGLKSTKDLDLSLVHYVVEHQENLNTVTVTLYGPNLPLNTDISIQAHDPASYSLPAVEAILTKDNTSLRIPMPVPIQSHQSVPLMTQGLFLEAKLSALPIAATVPSLISSINHPLSAAELRNIDPRGICCTSCDREIATVPRVLAKQPDMDERFKDLPSEYWAEMMEVWMCHQDPGFTAKLAERTREGFWPAEGKVLAGGSYLLLHQDDLKQANIRNNETDDVSWDAISCSCGEMLGKMRKQDGRPGAGTIRLSKWAISLLQENDDQGEAVQPRRHPLGTYITADMLELAQAHATYRFSIVNEESEKQQILIWLFNPSVRISYRRNSNISAVPPPSPLRNTHTDQSSSKSRRSSMSTASRPVSRGDSMGAATARTIRACKVMYRVTQNDDPQNKGAGQAQIEELKYPSEVVERLLATLKDSTNVYPEGRRKMGIWEVGFLERL